MNDILESIFEWFLVEPRRIVNLGLAMLYSGTTLLLGGLFGNLFLTATNASLQISRKQLHLELSSAFPNFPTWFIPEEFLGYFIAAMLICYGVYVTRSGKKCLKLHSQY